MARQCDAHGAGHGLDRHVTGAGAGDGISEVSAPVLDAAVAVDSRVQVAMSLPRVLASSDPTGPAGSWGTMFTNVELGMIRADRRGFNLSAAPTIEILSDAALAT